MLSDERISIAERLDRYAGSLDHELQGDLCNLMYDAAEAIRAALAEAAQVPVKRVAVTSDVVARLGGQRLCCDCGTVLSMDDGTMCGECFSNRFGESYSSKPPVAQVPVMGEAIWKKQKQAELDAKDARIRELEIAIQEIIQQNHYDFRGHEIAEAAMQERQS